MDLIGVGEYLLVFILPVVPPLLAFFWFVKSKMKGDSDSKGGRLS